jgi:hypothetical protein
MHITIYDDEKVEITRVEQGYHRIVVKRNGLLRLAVEIQGSHIVFVRGDKRSQVD